MPIKNNKELRCTKCCAEFDTLENKKCPKCGADDDYIVVNEQQDSDTYECPECGCEFDVYDTDICPECGHDVENNCFTNGFM